MVFNQKTFLLIDVVRIANLSFMGKTYNETRRSGQ